MVFVALSRPRTQAVMFYYHDNQGTIHHAESWELFKNHLVVVEIVGECL